MVIRREKTGLVVLAGDKGEAQALGHHIGWRRGAGAAFGAHFAADFKPIPIPTTRPQPGHLDMDRVRPLRAGGRGAGLDDPRHPFVFGDLPRDFDRFRFHPPADFQRPGGQPRPEHHPVGQRIPRSDSEGKRRVGKRAGSRHRARYPGREKRRRREGGAAGQEGSAAECLDAGQRKKRTVHVGKRVKKGRIELSHGRISKR